MRFLLSKFFIIGSVGLLVGCESQNAARSVVPTSSHAQPENQNSVAVIPSGAELARDVQVSIGTRTLGIPGRGAIIRDLVIDPLGRVTIAGRNSNESDDDMLVARFNPDGSLDSYFGEGGKVSLQFGTGSEMAHSLALQPDGKMVVAGRSDPQGAAFYDFAIARLEEDGSLDTSFNGTGKKLVNFGESTDIGRAIKVQDNGRIVSAGYSRTPHHSFPYRFASLRLFADGNFDFSFGEEGKVVTATVSGDNGATAMALQSDGKILVAGTSSNGTRNQMTVLRYRVDGSLDPDFGDKGILIQAWGDLDDVVNAVQVDGVGRILVAGSRQIQGEVRQAFVLRLLPDGRVDSSFAGTGAFSLNRTDGETEIRAMQLAGDNSIIGAGVACSGSCASGLNQFLISRIDSGGKLYENFANAGVETLSVFGTVDFADALSCTRNGVCVAGGRARNAEGIMELALHQFQVN